MLCLLLALFEKSKGFLLRQWRCCNVHVWRRITSLTYVTSDQTGAIITIITFQKQHLRGFERIFFDFPSADTKSAVPA